MTNWLVVITALLAGGEDATADVLTQIGRDGIQTRLYSVSLADLEGTGKSSLVVGGFTNLNGSDLSDIHVYDIREGSMELRWRVMWRGTSHSVLRTLRAADLDGDGRDEVVILGRVGDSSNHRHSNLKDRASAQLKVFGVRHGLFNAVDEVSWNNATYTHGYGLELTDLDGDGLPEIINSGFYDHGDTEHAELRVWKLLEGKLHLVASTHWGEGGISRINGIAAGDLNGDGRVEIVTAGRTGQIRPNRDVATEEMGQLTVWRLEAGDLVRVASREWASGGYARLRELILADLDSNGTMEIVAVGRVSAGQRPYVGILELTGNELVVKSEPTFPEDHLGEIRDVVFYGEREGLRMVTLGSRGVRPKRQGQLQVWKMQEGELELVQEGLTVLGDETRVRDLVLWPNGRSSQLVSVGFVRHGRRFLGQILDWGVAP